jgi:hypothetical protein
VTRGEQDPPATKLCHPPVDEQLMTVGWFGNEGVSGLGQHLRRGKLMDQ